MPALAQKRTTIRPLPAEPDAEVQARLERLAAIGARTAEVAHELRNALAVLETSLHLVRRSTGDHGDSRLHAHLERMAAQIHAGQAIVREVLDEVRGSRLERHPVELRSLVLEAVGGIEHADRVTIQVEADARSVDVDARQVRQLLVNLVRNAVEALQGSEQGGVVRVRASVEDATDSHAMVANERAIATSALRIEVSDDGPGLDPSVVSKLFSAFTTAKPGGTGLGLAVCKRIAQSHGGEISARALEPRGIAFQAVLPLPTTT
jgi:signal transduction histidine kinase